MTRTNPCIGVGTLAGPSNQLPSVMVDGSAMFTQLDRQPCDVKSQAHCHGLVGNRLSRLESSITGRLSEPWQAVSEFGILASNKCHS